MELTINIPDCNYCSLEINLELQCMLFFSQISNLIFFISLLIPQYSPLKSRNFELKTSAAKVQFSQVQTPFWPNQNQNQWFGSVQLQLCKLNRHELVRPVQFA